MAMPAKSIVRLLALPVALWLASCSTVRYGLPATVSIPTWTAAHTAQPAVLLPQVPPTRRATRTITASSPPTETVAFTPSPTLGPLITRTLAPPAKCPPPGNPAPIQAGSDPEELALEIERFLDEGGSVGALRRSLEDAFHLTSEGYRDVLIHIEE